ncbi:hypothetical protein ACFQLX_03690 [Streptomyces polyrhachis]|uniref:Uncharacterized protein n=1 Tax=Streptomyces polyrhachis TaxID=1282885 RepID=A0ABW2GDD2_9ACTN
MNSYLTGRLLPLAKELDQDKVTPGLLGFVVFAVLALAVWQLLRSMNTHMKRVDFEERQEIEEEARNGVAPTGDRPL